MNIPFVVALTGGIGSGKSSAAQYFSELGAGLVDTDEIAHRLTRPDSPAVHQIAARLGQEYRLADGSLDRVGLRRRVFSDPSAKAELEAVLHPLIRREAETEIARQTAPYVVVVVPLLFESGEFYRRLAQQIVVVDCAEEQQVSRTMARSSLSREEVQAIMARQAKRAVRLNQADTVLHNDGSPEELKAQVAALHQRLLELVAAAKPDSNRLSKTSH